MTLILNKNYKISEDMTEDDMQIQVDGFLKEQKFTKWCPAAGGYYYIDLQTIVLRELRIPEIGRISDHVLCIDKKRIVNIECKLYDIDKVIHQAKDHLRWCDYSVVCVTPHIYITNENFLEIIGKGIGLWYWFNNIGVFEFIMPKFNRRKNKELREKILNKILQENL
jgi:hypothetical protein